jgi:hypothetical protein
LTLWRTFDVINFAKCRVFRIGYLVISGFRIEMLMNHEFSIAHAVSIHRIIAQFSPQTFARLNSAHPKMISSSFLGWARKAVGAGLR